MLNLLMTFALTAFPVSQLDQDSLEYLNSKSVGVFTNEYKTCTAFVWDSERFITNNHCTRNGLNQVYYGQISVGEKLATGRLDSYDYGNDYSLLTTGESLPAPVLREVGKREGQAYIIHQRSGELLISYCSYWRVGAKYIKHNCDTASGASGSPVFDLVSNKAISLHWGWSLDEQGNKLEGYSNALEVVEGNRFFNEALPERFIYE